MKLCIADPPYLGRAVQFYGDGSWLMNSNASAKIAPAKRPDYHPDAHLWDDPATHEAMVRRLVEEYDGWVIAMVPRNLRHYLQWVPERTRVAVWHIPDVMPTGSHPRRRWESVLVYVPEGRRHVKRVPMPVGDVLTCSQQSGTYRPDAFAGQKPRQWTRWVLDMLGYDAETDTVDDLFHGSGAVAAETAQGVLL
jgi:hypothetical protein